MIDIVVQVRLSSICIPRSFCVNVSFIWESLRLSFIWYEFFSLCLVPRNMKDVCQSLQTFYFAYLRLEGSASLCRLFSCMYCSYEKKHHLHTYQNINLYGNQNILLKEQRASHRTRDVLKCKQAWGNIQKADRQTYWTNSRPTPSLNLVAPRKFRIQEMLSAVAQLVER